jgi:hypothetical protein
MNAGQPRQCFQPKGTEKCELEFEQKTPNLDRLGSATCWPKLEDNQMQPSSSLSALRWGVFLVGAVDWHLGQPLDDFAIQKRAEGTKPDKGAKIL